jgi:hypothetical protein
MNRTCGIDIPAVHAFLRHAGVQLVGAPEDRVVAAAWQEIESPFEVLLGDETPQADNIRNDG